MGRTVRKSRRKRRTNRIAAAKVTDTAITPSVIPEKPFPLLDLPAELRDVIYANIAANDDGITRIDKRKPGNLLSNSAMRMVNKQIREEFTSALYLSAPNITTTVQDFDFRHIVTFFNRLSDLELNALSSTRAQSSPTAIRKLTIHLTVSQKCPWDRQYLYLDRWLNRCAHPTKKGTNVRVVYTADRSSLKQWWNLTRWIGSWSTIRRQMDPGPRKEELMKIGEAMRKALVVSKAFSMRNLMDFFMYGN